MNEPFYPHRHDPIMVHAGIYRIKVSRNNEPDKFYIGQTSHMRRRWVDHFRLLRLGTHWSPDLQMDFNELGQSAFRFEIVLICAKDRGILALYEQIILDSYEPTQVYNIWRLCSTSGLGTKASPERKAKIAAKITGLKRSVETKAAISRAQAWKKTPEGRLKLSAAQVNRLPMPAEERARRSLTTHFRNPSPEMHKKGGASLKLRALVLRKSTAWMLY